VGLGESAIVGQHRAVVARELACNDCRDLSAMHLLSGSETGNVMLCLAISTFWCFRVAGIWGAVIFNGLRLAIPR